MLKENERLDDLLTHRLHIIQSADVFSFSLDAVLLARFCTVPVSPSARIVDLCSGNGVVALLLSTRTKASITGVELQPRLWDMAARSVVLNRLQEQIVMVQADLRQWAIDSSRNGAFDMVTVNPPYLPVSQGMQNVNEHMALARHEVMCKLEDALFAAGRLTRPGGRVAMVHRPSRLMDILEGMRRHRLEPKRIRFVHPKPGHEANMVLIEAHRDGKPDVRLLPPLIVMNDHNEYAPELVEIFKGKEATGRHEDNAQLHGGVRG